MAKNPSRRATPSAANRGTQTRPGDATGAEAERLRKENADALRDASKTTTMVNPPPPVEQTDAVVDLTGGGSPNVGGAGEPRLITMAEATADGTPVSQYDVPDEAIDMDSLPTGQSDVLPEVVPGRTEEPQPAHGARQDSQQQVRQQGAPAPAQRPAQVDAPKVEQAFRVLRVNTDLEDITIGKDNHFTFEVGTPYKVEAHVYDHLKEKGYVLY